MTRLFISFYYLGLSVFVFQRGRLFVNKAPIPDVYSMMAAPFNWLPESEFYFPLVFLFALGFCCAAVVVQRQWVLVLASICFALFVSMMSSFGKVNHSYHALIYLSLFIPFLDLSNGVGEKGNLLLVRICQATLLSTYFTSGLWKFRRIGFSGWTAAAQENVAGAVAYGRGPHQFIIDNFIINNTWILTTGFLAIFIFQICCILPVIKPRMSLLFGILICIFHLMTGIFMGIWMPHMFFAALFILVLTELHFLKTSS